MGQHLLEVKELHVNFNSNEQDLNVIDGVNFYVKKGESLGIVGESGSGKSVTSLSVMGLLPLNGKVKHGSIQFKDKNIVNLSKKDLRNIRGKEIAMIFQEPMTSLNPVYTVGSQIIEVIRTHKKVSKKEAKEHAIKMLKLVGIPRAEQVVDEYPHQLSGGMRQRVMIAMAMSLHPELLIADEPTTALDVTIQAQILDLMKKLQREMEMSIILITHDLGVVSEICDRVVVMYAGQVVEEAEIDDLFDHPKHPYTIGLIESIPTLEEEKEYLYSIPGTVPSPDQMPSGCRFAPRCSKAEQRCFQQAPPMIQLKEYSRVRCWLYEEQGVK
ncbi:ABC transporter ATP-binding protein [Tepidibacillus infernus]|uniref:ABC transporter ATP-binding protein n=1 Tax=Tepidibacillus infernus TaxID=1806172 RepID=UPI003B6DF58E